MADEGQLIRGIDWRQTFPFTHIFRTFRIAIHPSKLVLGLALLLTVYVGGRVLDAVWPSKSRAVPTEVAIYEGARNRTEFDSRRNSQRKGVEETYSATLQDIWSDPKKPSELPKDPNEAKKVADAAAVNGDLLSKAEARAESDRNDASAENDKAYNKNKDEINKEGDKRLADAKTQADKDKVNAEKAKYLDEAKKQHDQGIEETNEGYKAKLQRLQAIRGEGLFAMFFEYQINQINGVVQSVLSNQWFSGPNGAGVLGHVYNFFTVGTLWLARVHTVFAILFAILFLAAWSLFGGAISRIAAVHIARDEKISVRQAINFAVGKFLSFASAPVIPMLIVIVVGLLVALVALLGNIPFLGPIVIGATFVLALLAGFVMTLVILGTIGGFNLMYPTVAVEGSDSFDAISRSFSYVYARPWRMMFYTAVAVGYGAATYLFVKLFITLMLTLTHHFVGLGILTHDSLGHPLFPSMWPDPANTSRLTYSIDTSVLSVGETIGARLLGIWIYLIIATLGAFAISFYFSASTIIYYLMRHELDATEMDDVYLEQSEEDFADTAPAVVSTPTTPGIPPVVSAPVVAAPAVSPPAVSPPVITPTEPTPIPNPPAP